MSDYLLDNAWEQQRRRLAGLEAWFDPGTVRHLEALGVAPGWRCLEVGAGAGSIAAWLAHRVGPSGHVLATDLDTRLLAGRGSPNLAVLRHDILAEELPEGDFDLVHARFLLEHLPDRATALRRMAAALAPGGWLLVEETDSSSWVPDPAADPRAGMLFARWTQAFVALCRLAGADAYAGRRAYGELRALGLDEIDAAGRVFMSTPPRWTRSSPCWPIPSSSGWRRW
jgi:SAM-dependent methyltransferase